MDDSVAADNMNEEKTSSMDTNRVECPWCGERGTTGKRGAEGAARGAEPRSDSGRGRASNSDGVAEDGRRSPAVLTRGHDRDLMRMQTCDSCGFRLPNSDLWAVPNSPTDHIPVRWDDVRAAGHQWRKHADADVIGTGHLENDSEETAASMFFREACLRGRDERERMRCRQRREERNLESSTHLQGVVPIADGEEGDNRRARSKSVAPSKRKLELELDLGERQARERKKLASQQLHLHGRRGIGDTGGRSIDGGTCVVVLDLRWSAEDDTEDDAEDDQQQRSNREISMSNAVQTATTDRRDETARNMQRLWTRYRERRACAVGSPQDMNINTTGPADEKAVTKLQSAFRGFHVRRALQVKRQSSLPRLTRTFPRIEYKARRLAK